MIKKQLKCLLFSAMLFTAMANGGVLYELVDLSGTGLSGGFELIGGTGVGIEILIGSLSQFNVQTGSGQTVADADQGGTSLTHNSTLTIDGQLLSLLFKQTLGNKTATFRLNDLTIRTGTLPPNIKFETFKISWQKVSVPIAIPSLAPSPGNPVPEPSTYAVFAMGLGSLAMVHRRRKTRT